MVGNDQLYQMVKKSQTRLKLLPGKSAVMSGMMAGDTANDDDCGSIANSHDGSLSMDLIASTSQAGGSAMILPQSHPISDSEEEDITSKTTSQPDTGDTEPKTMMKLQWA